MDCYLKKIALIKRINKVGADEMSQVHKGNLMSELGDMDEIQLTVEKSTIK